MFPANVRLVFTSEKNAIVQKEILLLKIVLEMILTITLQAACQFILHLK